MSNCDLEQWSAVANQYRDRVKEREKAGAGGGGKKTLSDATSSLGGYQTNELQLPLAPPRSNNDPLTFPHPFCIAQIALIKLMYHAKILRESYNEHVV